MAQLLPRLTAKGKRKQLPASLKVDMTPMVDLGFLLITFFIFTTTMAESKATDLPMPKEGQPIDIKESAALTLLLHADDHVHMYEGGWEAETTAQKIKKTTFDNKLSIREFIRQKQTSMGENKDQLMVLIKPGEQSRYRNVVDALDEMLLNNVKRYAVVDVTTEEKAYLSNITQ